MVCFCCRHPVIYSSVCDVLTTCIHMHVVPVRLGEGAELELQVFVNCVWVLETKSESSARVAGSFLSSLSSSFNSFIAFYVKLGSSKFPCFL